MNKIKVFLILSIFISLISCKSIPVETTNTEYKYIYSTDTIIQNNTTYIKETGDTVYIKEIKEIYKYRDRVDTCIIKDTTTLVVYKDKIEYVEVNKIKDWQIILMVLGGLFIGIIGYKLIRII
jgi:hypothetical protein